MRVSKKSLQQQRGEQAIWAEPCRTPFKSKAGVHSALPPGPTLSLQVVLHPGGLQGQAFKKTNSSDKNKDRDE